MKPAILRIVSLFIMSWLLTPRVTGAEVKNEQAPSTSRDVSVVDIVGAWKARNTKYRSGKLEWVTNHSYEKLIYASFNQKDEPVKLTPEDVKALKGQRIEFETFSKFSIDGNRMRYELSGRRPAAEFRLVDVHSVSASDGETSKNLIFPGEDRPYSQGRFLKNPTAEAIYNLDTKPLLWTFACVEETVSQISLRDLTVVETKARIGSIDCIVLREIMPKSRIYSEYWVAPSQEFSIIRYIVQEGNFIQLQLETELAASEDGLWFPKRWRASRFEKDGRLSTYEESVVRKFEINPRFDPSEFQIPFDVPGMLVSDARGPKNKRNLSYIVRNDGTHRMVQPHEHHLSYEELMRTISSEGSGFNKKTAVSIILIATASFLIVLVWRKRQKKGVVKTLQS
jgi:hypothetical protein